MSAARWPRRWDKTMLGATTPGAALSDDERQAAAQLRRKTLGDFLRSARGRVTPAAVGLPAGRRRRTPGLRREELAQLCDISTTWYTWIEQGRDVSVSGIVLARLADTLSLSRAERHYLFELAETVDPQHGNDTVVALPPALADCVHSITAPSYILDQSWNILACNQPLLQLFNGWPARVSTPNLLRYIFLDPAAPALIVDWELRASRVVAEFRADAGARADAPGVRALIDELLASSAVFAKCWTGHSVVDREGGLREFRHETGAVLSYQQITFRLAIRPDCKLVMLLENKPSPP
jgi:transcriptional regulator with XRE-family HTH domain